MTRFALLASAIAFAVGCDAVSTTDLAVHANSRGLDRSTEFAAEVIGVCRDASDRFGLSEIESDRRGARMAFTDSIPGHNPDLWLTLEHGTDPAKIEIAEMYISSPTEKHKQLAASLMDGFDTVGLRADITYQTSDGIGWVWIIFAAILIAGVVILGFMLHRSPPRSSNTEQ